MKLDYDCMRDVLLVLEEQLQFGDVLEYPQLSLYDIYNCFDEEQYSFNEIAYTVLKLSEAGFINDGTQNSDDSLTDFVCTDITFEGHQYLDTVRSPKIWNKIHEAFETKSINMSVELILKVATSVIEAILFL